MNKTENTLYILQNLSSTESKDLDYAEIDVYYEDEQGNEGAAQYDMPAIADDSISTINELQKQIAELEKDKLDLKYLLEKNLSTFINKKEEGILLGIPMFEDYQLKQQAKGVRDFFTRHPPRISMGKSAIWEIDDVLVDEAIEALKEPKL